MSKQHDCMIEITGHVEADFHICVPWPKPQPLTAAIAVKFTGGTVPQPNNILVLNVGQTSQASIMPLLADGTTPSQGAVSNVQYNFADPSAAMILNADGVTATVTGVKDSGGNPVSGNAQCTVTDTNGAVSQWTQGFTIQTNAGVLPDQITQSVAVQFSDPV